VITKIIFLTRSPLASERCCILDDVLILTFLENIPRKS
jgi:hypothetical protein